MLEELYGLENTKILPHLVKNQNKKKPKSKPEPTKPKETNNKNKPQHSPKMQTNNKKKRECYSFYRKTGCRKDCLCH